MAFGVLGYLDQEGKDDDDYVKWVVTMQTKKGLNITDEPLEIYKCTD